jgi:hypothetical protein
MLQQILETAAHVLLDVDIHVVFAKTRQFSRRAVPDESGI